MTRIPPLHPSALCRSVDLQEELLAPTGELHQGDALLGDALAHGEETEVLAVRVNPGFGVLMATSAMATVFATLLDDPSPVRGADHLLDAVRTARDAAVPDVVLGRPCRFAAGMMVGLDLQGFVPDEDDRRFGHIGLAGMAFGDADPRRGIGVAAWFNGAASEESIREGRREEYGALTDGARQIIPLRAW